MDPEILSILGYPGQSRVVPPGLSQVLIRENTHILQYLVSWETRDHPELSQSGIENKQYSCSNIGDLCEAHHQRQIPSTYPLVRQDMRKNNILLQYLVTAKNRQEIII